MFQFTLIAYYITKFLSVTYNIPLYPVINVGKDELFRGESKKTEIPIPYGYFSLALIGILLQMKCLRNQNNLHQKIILERIFPFCRIAELKF